MRGGLRERPLLTATRGGSGLHESVFAKSEEAA